MVNYYVTIADKSQTAPGLRQQTGACFIAKGSTMVYSFMNPLSSTFESAVTELALREGHLLHHCTCLSPSAQQKRTRPPGSRMCLFATGSKLLKERDGESPKKWTPGCCQQHQTAPLWISKSKTGLTINRKKDDFIWYCRWRACKHVNRPLQAFGFRGFLSQLHTLDTGLKEHVLQSPPN